jgi:hypothetical protein
VTLLNLEIWGLPTSNPAADPGNGGFVYQRYQRGIMHFDASCGCTQGILVGEYLKSVITGKNLPPDLHDDMLGSRFLEQYSPGSPGWVARPAALSNTDMNGAFEQGTGAVTQPPAPPAQATIPVVVGAATATATVTPTATAAGPNVTVQVDDDTIDPGQTVSVTVIANHNVGIDWIEFEGVYDGNQNSNKNDNDSPSDAAFARQRFDCDDSQTQCANVWTITPNVSGRYTLRARARDVNDVRSDWVGISFRVRGNSTGATATATATTGAQAAPTSTPTPVPGQQAEPAATATPTKTS